MRRTKSEQISHGKQMEKWFGLQVCKVLLSHGIPYNISHMKDEYCCVDFKMKHTETNTMLCFLELKSRSGISTYDSYRIGLDKMREIHNTNKKPAYLIWYDESNGKMFYTEYSTDFMHYRQYFCKQARNYYILIDRCDTIECTIEEMVLQITT